MVGILVVLVLAACNRGPTGQEPLPPQYQSGTDIRNALVKSGLGCDEFQPISAHHRSFGEEDAVETDACRVDNQDVSISMWKGLGQKQDWARTRTTMGCQFADSLGNTPPVYVDGGRWTVRVESRMLASRISDAIGGDVRAADCRSVD